MKALLLALLLPGSAHAAYNVAVSTNYAKSWFSTTGTGSPAGQVRHVNSSLATPPGPYTFYWKIPFVGTFSDNGTGLVSTGLGRDCANFVSQCLQAGGITMPGDGGQNNTFIGAARLGAALKSIATETRFSDPSGIPSNLSPGDVIVWNQAHATIVSSGQGSGVKLAAHTWDRFDAPLSMYFDWFKVGRAYHITGTNITVSGDVTAPTMNIFNFQNFVIPTGGWGNGYAFTATVSDSGDGVDWLEVVTSTPILDREIEPSEGLASYVFVDPTHYGASHTYSVNLYSLSDGTTVYFQAFDGAGNLNLQSFRLDRVPPTTPTIADTSGNPITTATSSTTVVITGSDALSGAYTLNLTDGGSYNETSTNTMPSPNTPYSATFPIGGGALADGSYTATVMDQAGNQASVSFTVDSSGSNTSANPSTSNNIPISSSTITAGQCIVPRASNNVSGITSLSFGGNGLSTTTANFAASTSAALGPFCNLAVGTYTFTATSGSGIQNSYSAYSTNPTGNVNWGTSVTGGSSHYDASFGCSRYAGNPMQVSASGFDTGNPSLMCAKFTFSPGSSTCTITNVGGSNYEVTFSTIVSATDYVFTLTNGDTNTYGATLGASIAGVNNIGGLGAYAASYTAQVTAPECGVVPFPSVASSNGAATVTPYFAGTQVAAQQPAGSALQAALSSVFGTLSGLYYYYFGSEVVFVATAPISIAYQPPSGVVVDTTTLQIYAFNGVAWSTSSISNQTVSDSTSGMITASGIITTSGLYAALFNGHDSSAPVTTFSFQGSSFTFNQNLFVSTYSYAVLTATDPVVNGFASQVASITYCFDPSSGSVFSVYTSSIPLPLGTHVFQYQSYDYAGNLEAVNTTTFTVTAGTAFKESSDDVVAGNLLVGFLGSGAQAEVVARAQDSTTLQVSSANHQPLLSVTNIGNVGVGVPAPYGQLDVAPSTVALQLRSGNLTPTGTSVEAAFGYNGDVSMRHAIRTFHSTATVGNELDFLVWTPAAGSTATIATSELLALQASTIASNGSMHILPVGTAVAELEVSNGLSTGGGTMQRLQVLTPSSKRFKSDIRYLKEKDEDLALAETAALKHVRYRYRSRAKDGGLYDDPRQQERVGLIYEDAPDSIRGPNQTLLTNERLANVELALRAAMRKLEALEKRYKALQARKPK